MKIALYQPWIYLHGGLEKSLLELVSRSEHEWIVYTGHYDAKGTFKEFANVDVRVLNPTTVKRTIGGTLKSAYQAATQKIPATDDIDAIAIWCDGIGDLATFRNQNRPLVNICSTPLRAAFDPVYEQLSLEKKSIVYKLAYKAFKHLFILVDRLAWSYYDVIVTTSTEVKNRIIKGRLCQDETKMMMAYPGIEWKNDTDDIAYEPFILLPGRIMWTKNIQQGIEAFVKSNLPKPWKLVVAGYVDAKSQVYLEEMRALVPEGIEVEFVVSPSNEALEELYKKASFCLFTPQNEDWGIVPLESMSYGKPVIANASGGPLESIVHNETGCLVETNHMQGWVTAIRQLANNPEQCKAMGIKAREHVKKFTWDTFVSRVDAAIVEVINAKKNAKKPTFTEIAKLTSNAYKRVNETQK
jgi:glycosyltransferase involved in cell wall biosynthesis